jgi:class 3 adenylate cyclase/ABC-type oligopeptide transport system substrate-binding subunit
LPVSGALRAGQEVAGYRIVELIGESGSGTVYLAEETGLGRRVALKLLAPELARDERFRERFLRESRVAASLDHPNIVPLYAAGEADGVLYLAMRYVERDLRQLLAGIGRLPPERAVAIVSQVAAGLDAAHARGLVHRDVKPPNILLTGEPERELAYLCDFGLAKHAATPASLTREDAFAGTIDYVAPEQVSGGSIDGRTDLYSLGCVLFECLTGAPPFKRTTELAVLHAHLATPPPRVSEARTDLPEALDEVLGGALAKEPDDRYATCGDFATAAAAALAGHRPALPAGARVAERAVRTFMFADVRGYTRYTRERGDEAAGRLASEFAELVDVVVREHGGAVQELRGDEALMVFDSARDALGCALALQRRFAERDFELGVGIGIDAGEAVPVQGGFRGGALNLASRLCAAAGPGEVLASQGVVHLAGPVDGAAYEGPRPMRLKGYSDVVRGYEVVPADRVSGGFARALRRTRRAVGARRRLAAAIGVALAAAAAAVAALLLVGGGSSEAAIDPGVALLDAKTGEPVGHVSVKKPVEAIYKDGSFWVLNLEPLSFVQIDAKTRRIVRQISAPFGDIGYYAVDGNDLWVTDYTGPNLSRVDIQSGRETARISLSNDRDDTTKTVGVVVVDGSVWVTRPQVGEVIQVDPSTEEVVRRVRNMFGSDPLAYGDGALWTFTLNGVARIDPETGTVFGATDRVASTSPYIVVGGGFAWTTNESTGTVYKIDRGRRIAASYRTGEGARTLAYDDGHLWVGNQDAGTVTAIDAVTGSRRTYDIGHPLGGIAAGGGLVLVEVVPGATFADRIDSLEGEVAKLLVEPYQIENADPALAPSFLAFQVERATCANLLRYADAAAPRGWRLLPELAATMPQVSAGGRTYTFRVRSGYGFAPPSNDPVTASAIRASLERALSPQLGSQAPGIRYLGDVVGAQAYHAGKARRISGMRAAGNRLTITLRRRAPDFLRRLSMPFFCTVPADTARVATLPFAPPSAGPYYVSGKENGEYLILKRNPHYDGPRRVFFDAIALREGIDPAQAVARVQAGTWDGSSSFGPTYAPGGELERAWGAGGARARTGGRRYFAAPLGNSDYLALNASRPLFRDVRMRRALAYAVNREAMAGLFEEIPSDQLLTAALPGFRDRRLYPSDPDLTRAKRLARPAVTQARMLVRSDCSQCLELGRLVETALAELGVDLEIEQREDFQPARRGPESEYDIFNGFTAVDYPDGAAFLRTTVGETVPEHWFPPGISERVAAVDRVAGDRRDTAAAALADDLVRDAVLIPFGTFGRVEFLSPRLGCKVFPPLGYGVSLATLCRAPSA